MLRLTLPRFEFLRDFFGIENQHHDAVGAGIGGAIARGNVDRGLACHPAGGERADGKAAPLKRFAEVDAVAHVEGGRNRDGRTMEFSVAV